MKLKSYFPFILAKHIFIYSILFPFISSCILFRESKWDPNGFLSNLITLYLFNEVAKGQEYETKVKFLENGSIAGDTVIRVTKVSGEYQLPSTAQEDNSGEFVGTFQQASDGFTKIYFPTLGRFRLDLYKFPSRQFHGSVLIDLLKSTDTQFTIVDQKFTGNFSYIENTVRRIVKRSHEPFEFYTFKEVKTLGTFGDSAYFSMQILFNKDFKISTSNVYIKGYNIVFYTQDGENFKSFLLSEYPFEGSQGSENFDYASDINVFVDSGDFITGFLTKSIAGSNNSWFLLKLPKLNPEQYTSYQITARSGTPFDTIEMGSFTYLDQKYFYKEYESSNPANISWRFDTNFLQTGSGNSPVPTSANDPFTNGNNRFVNNNQIVNSDFITTYYASDSAVNAYTGSYSHNSPLSASGEIFGNPYKIFLKEYTNSPSDQYRISTTSQLMQNGINLNFSDGYSIPYNVTNRVTTFNPTKTALFLEYQNPSDINNTIESFTEWNHSDTSFKSLTIPTVIPSMVDFKINFKANANCLLSNSKYICAYKRLYEDPLGVLKSRNEPFLIGSNSVDGLTWSDWREIVFNPTIR